MKQPIDAVSVLNDIWHRGLCGENVNDFEVTKNVLCQLIDEARWALEAIHDGDAQSAIRGLTSVLSKIKGEIA